MEINYVKQTLKILYKNYKNYYKARTARNVKLLDPSKKYAFIFFAADYNNLGDIAITLAQRSFLAECVPDFEIIEVPEGETYRYYKVIKSLPKDKVLITIIGGGNNGTLYEFLEEPRRFLLRHFKKYRIVSFPQTVIFEDTSRGKPYKKEFARLCNRCYDLTLTAREQYSYETYKKITSAKSILTPDIVLSLRQPSSSLVRDNKVAAIFRDDKEKAIGTDLEATVLSCAIRLGFEIVSMDTCAIDITNGREEEFNAYINKLSSVKLAITDRLHGMILCYITKTPCIVLNINNPKIESTYETWLKDQNFIYLLRGDESTKEIKSIINGLTVLENPLFADLTSSFLPLYNACKRKGEYDNCEK